MGRTRLGIYDRESEYARSLGNFLRRRSGDSLEVKLFTRLDALGDCLEGGGLDAVLIDAEAEALCRTHVCRADLGADAAFE